MNVNFVKFFIRLKCLGSLRTKDIYILFLNTYKEENFLLILEIKENLKISKHNFTHLKCNIFFQKPFQSSLWQYIITTAGDKYVLKVRLKLICRIFSLNWFYWIKWIFNIKLKEFNKNLYVLYKFCVHMNILI